MTTPITPKVSLDEVERNLTSAAGLPAEVKRRVTLRCAALISACAAGGPDPVDARPVGVSTEATDDWLTPDQATHLLKKPRRWLVRHHRELPFARKISHKTILFSRTGALRWMETRPR